jgi:hypothetical protein
METSGVVAVREGFEDEPPTACTRGSDSESSVRSKAAKILVGLALPAGPP